jgi:hypothetical protein
LSPAAETVLSILLAVSRPLSRLRRAWSLFRFAFCGPGQPLDLFEPLELFGTGPRPFRTGF